MPLRPSAGRSAVSRRAIADIVLASVRGSYGVVGFATPTIGGHLVRLLRLGEPGIRVRIDDGVLVELHVRVAHGLPVAEVARQVDSAVRYALRRDLGRQVVRVAVHIDGLDDGPTRIPGSVAIESGAVGSLASETVAPDGPAGDTETVAPDSPASDAETDVDTLSQRIGGAA